MNFLHTVGVFGVTLFGLIAFGLIYQLVAGKLLKIKHHWLPLFWAVNWYNSRKERSGSFHGVIFTLLQLICFAQLILYFVFRLVDNDYLSDFGIWKVAGRSFSVWLPFLAHKTDFSLSILSAVVWGFWVHCMATLIVHWSFPRVELVDGLKIGLDSEGRLVSKIRWEEMPFQSPVKSSFVFLKKPNPAARHTIPLAVRHGQVTSLNLAQETMWGFVGGTNSGKTSAVTGFCASIATVDEHTLFVFVDIIKNGSQYRVFECDPRLVHSAFKPVGITVAQWQRKQARLPNVLVIDKEETLVSFVNALDYEINYRGHLLGEHYGRQSLYDLEDPAKTKIDKTDRFNPPRLFRIVVILDDWAVIRDEYKGDDVGKATSTLLQMVSFARFAKVHLLFISQKATIADYFPGAARDQIFWMGYALPINQSAYVLKKEVTIPSAMGVCGYVGSGANSEIGVGCTPFLSPLGGVKVFTKAAEKIIAIPWGIQNRDRMLAFRARCEADAGPEIMERVSLGQQELLKAQVIV